VQPPLVGSWQVEIVAARPYEIHSDRYYELLVTRLDDLAGPSAEAPEAVLRAPAHAFSSPPAAGQRVAVSFLMGQVTGVLPI